MGWKLWHCSFFTWRVIVVLSTYCLSEVIIVSKSCGWKLPKNAKILVSNKSMYCFLWQGRIWNKKCMTGTVFWKHKKVKNLIDKLDLSKTCRGLRESKNSNLGKSLNLVLNYLTTSKTLAFHFLSFLGSNRGQRGMKLAMKISKLVFLVRLGN